jgi:hypothetical protein
LWLFGWSMSELLLTPLPTFVYLVALTIDPVPICDGDDGRWQDEL